MRGIEPLPADSTAERLFPDVDIDPRPEFGIRPVKHSHTYTPVQRYFPVEIELYPVVTVPTCTPSAATA